MIQPESAAMASSMAARSEPQANWTSTSHYRPTSETAQVSLIDGVGAIWKSPRDRTRSIEATLREYNGNASADFRLMQMDGSGLMPPPDQRPTVSAKQLGPFAMLVADTYRTPDKFGCTPTP